METKDSKKTYQKLIETTSDNMREKLNKQITFTIQLEKTKYTPTVDSNNILTIVDVSKNNVKEIEMVITDKNIEWKIRVFFKKNQRIYTSPVHINKYGITYGTFRIIDSVIFGENGKIELHINMPELYELIDETYEAIEYLDEKLMSK